MSRAIKVYYEAASLVDANENIAAGRTQCTLLTTDGDKQGDLRDHVDGTPLALRRGGRVYQYATLRSHLLGQQYLVARQDCYFMRATSIPPTSVPVDIYTLVGVYLDKTDSIADLLYVDAMPEGTRIQFAGPMMQGLKPRALYTGIVAVNAKGEKFIRINKN